MSLIKFKNRNRYLPIWKNDCLESFINDNDFYKEDNLIPAINIKELNKYFEIEFAVPGFSKQDFKITIDDSILNVTGGKQIEKEEKEDDYTRKEFSYNSFKRSLRLPNSINTEHEVKATYENGILKLNLLKKEDAISAPKKVIEVK